MARDRGMRWLPETVLRPGRYLRDLAKRSPSRMAVLIFFLAAVLFSGLLTLPVSSADGRAAPLQDAVCRSTEIEGHDVQLVGINFRESSVETGRSQAKTWGFTWPSIYDKSGTTSIAMQGKMTTQPSTAVLDRQGRIAAVVLGATTQSTLQGLIEDTLAEEGR